MTELTEQPRPSPPTFLSFEEERIYRKQHLAAALRVFGRLGFSEGPAGHVTARDPERLDQFWVNPYGMHFSQVRASDLVLVNHQGEVLEGARPVNRAAFIIHSQIHMNRPDVVAAAHMHSVYGRAWSCLGRRLDPINQDVCSFYDDHALFADFTGGVLELDEGERLAKTLGPARAIILQNHGLLTVGRSVDEAAWLFIRMERCCQAQLLAEAAGKPVLIDAETATLTRQQSASAKAGWFSFQSFYDWIVEQEPTLLD
jgi:ribulose-5-phosphate 4-epimerase/fuculose-1-phosphate aldolase